jgi:uncharacterized membrane protein
MADLESQLQRWTEAKVIDSVTADRIRQLEQETGVKRPRWPAVLAVSFGALMLCAGILLFVAAHWDELSPTYRFVLVLVMVALFHLLGGLLGAKVESLGIAMHVAGTAALGAGVYLAGQIFNLEEHWPGGLMLWALGAVLAWFILRQWPQALLAAVLIPWWLAGEWDVATENYTGASNIAAQGLLLLAILYMSATPRQSNRALRLGLIWTGSLALLECIIAVIVTANERHWGWGLQRSDVPRHLLFIGYAVSYLPALAIAAYARKRESLWMAGAAAWVFCLAALSQAGDVEHNVWVYLWLALGASAFCFWGVRAGRKLFINFGIVIFALTVVWFYFSDVMDKLGRSMGLILLGAIFLAGGWVLHRLRTDLIARAAAGGTR